MINSNKILGNILGKPKRDCRSRNNTQYRKLLVNTWFKTYDVADVSEATYNNSPSIERAGSMEGIKVRDDAHLSFMIKELKLKGFKEE